MNARAIAAGWILAMGGASVFACSEESSHVAFEEPDASSAEGEASLPPVSTYEAGSDDVFVPVQDASIPFDGASEPVTCKVSPCVAELAGGETYFCARMSDGTVRCWGTDLRGSLGRADLDGGSDAAMPPAIVDGLEGVAQISARQTVCARLETGTVKCWGSNGNGQLGVRVPPASDTLAHPIPTEVPLHEPAVRVDTNDFYTCAVLASGKLECWGATQNGLLARTVTGSVGGPDIATKIEASIFKTSTGMAITDAGELVTWGAILGREVSVPPSNPAFTPRTIASFGPVHDVASEAVAVSSQALGHACAIVSGEVYCWGTTNAYGALCTGISNTESEPVHVAMPLEAGVFALQVAVSKKNTCVRLGDRTVRCCGVDDLGQLGRGSVTDGGPTIAGGVPISPIFVAAEAVSAEVVQIALGGDTACALLRDGSVACWGSNVYGQLGQGTRDSAPHPVPSRVQF